MRKRFVRGGGARYESITMLLGYQGGNGTRALTNTDNNPSSSESRPNLAFRSHDRWSRRAGDSQAPPPRQGSRQLPAVTLGVTSDQSSTLKIRQPSAAAASADLRPLIWGEGLRLKGWGCKPQANYTPTPPLHSWSHGARTPPPVRPEIGSHL